MEGDVGGTLRVVLGGKGGGGEGEVHRRSGWKEEASAEHHVTSGANTTVHILVMCIHVHKNGSFIQEAQ